MEMPTWVVVALPVGTLLLDRVFRLVGGSILDRQRRARKDGAGEVSSQNVESDIERLFQKAREVEGSLHEHQLKCERLTGEVLTEVRFIKESVVEIKRDMEQARAQMRNWFLGAANRAIEILPPST